MTHLMEVSYRMMLQAANQLLPGFLTLSRVKPLATIEAATMFNFFSIVSIPSVEL